jgi:VIT1/CCC1 family predicted Fe2+/Mn2+ transporter
VTPARPDALRNDQGFPTVPRSHRESHLISRIGWLRAAVLGANDGIISTASLMVGVAAAATPRGEVLTAGLAGLVAGAMSMAAGEYVSVSSQSDTESADLTRERKELAVDPGGETSELTQIYVDRGLDPALARQVAEQLMAKDAIGAHARDELGISAVSTARPIQAALTSAATFTGGAVLPLLAAVVSPRTILVPTIFVVALIVLAVLGAVGAQAGGAGLLKPTIRVAFWGALAMAITAAVGAIVGHAV